MIGILCASAAIGLSRFTVQMAAIEISPPELLPLGGYTERKGALALPGGDLLYSRTLLLSQGDRKIALVAVDALTIPASLAQSVQKRIGPNITVLLTATHTHCAPDSQMLNSKMTMAIPGIASFRRKWLEWYTEKISLGIESAKSTRPVNVDAVYIQQADVLGNRGRRPLTIPDPTVTLVSAKSGEKLIPLFLQFAAHPVLYGPEENRTRSDWPGKVSASLGCMVIQGALGDVSPLSFGESSETRVANLAARLVNAVQKAKPVSVFSADSRMTYLSSKLELDTARPHPDFAKTNKIPQPLAFDLVKRFAESDLDVSILSIGRLRLVFVPAEPSAELGRAIVKQEAEAKQISLVVPFTNGWIGYLLMPDDYDRGGYEASLSFHGRNTASRVLEAVKRCCLGARD